MNNKGFAITGIMYSVLLVFLIMISTMLFNLQNRKTILDELKLDTIGAVETENNYDYLLNEINALKAANAKLQEQVDILSTNDEFIIKIINIETLTATTTWKTMNLTYDTVEGYEFVSAIVGNISTNFVCVVNQAFGTGNLTFHYLKVTGSTATFTPYVRVLLRKISTES